MVSSFDNKMLMQRKLIEEIIEKPIANPSNPSIQFIAFIIPEIHRTVIRKLKKGVNPILIKLEESIEKPILKKPNPKCQTIDDTMI